MEQEANAMIRSLFSGLSGIKSNQLALDVIGNNVANVNTPAFKAGSASFSDALSLTVRSGTQPTETRGGLDPMQIGRGAFIGSIGQSFTQGSMEATNNPTDVGIAGEGFFILRNGTEEFYTRDGSFQIDAKGKLVDPSTGFTVRGRMADADGILLSSAPISDIVLPIESLFPARSTSKITFSGNLDADAGVADVGADGIDNNPSAEAYQASVLVYDSLGNTHTMTVTYGLTDTPNQWTWEVALTSDDPNVMSGTTRGLIHFSGDGSIDDVTTPAEIVVDVVMSGAAGAGNGLANGALEQTVTINFGDLAQFSGSFSPVPSFRNGHGMGALSSVNFDNTGALVGTFTNGATQMLAQLVLADFYNPSGLVKAGGNMYVMSMNSGSPLVGVAGTGIRAAIVPGTLESSNVDLANEFTRMIIAQRGFEANARVVMTSDSILGDLISLKR